MYSECHCVWIHKLLFEDDLDMTVRLSSCCNHATVHNNNARSFKIGWNVSYCCSLFGIDNEIYRTIHWYSSHIKVLTDLDTSNRRSYKYKWIHCHYSIFCGEHLKIWGKSHITVQLSILTTWNHSSQKYQPIVI